MLLHHDIVYRTTYMGRTKYLAKGFDEGGELLTENLSDAHGFRSMPASLPDQCLGYDEWHADSRDRRQHDPVNLKIVEERLKAFNKVRKPRVGDFLQLPNGRFTRFTHDWDDSIQTGGMGGSYHFPGEYMSYSGGLDPGLKTKDIVPEPIGERPGSFWIFDRDLSGAGRGVYFTAPMRVYALRPDADVSSVWDMDETKPQ